MKDNRIAPYWIISRSRSTARAALATFYAAILIIILIAITTFGHRISSSTLTFTGLTTRATQ